MSPRTAGLFVAALVGVLTVVGLALAPLGWLALGPYLVVVLTGIVLSARKAQALRRHQAGRTCTCCTSTVFDPVEIR
ncbi:MAG: hypothetical protein JWN87_166 [Frankiales bacterium]|jgi:hypothetical protein|nr:hypothetical protein [Frankiales bacterium]